MKNSGRVHLLLCRGGSLGPVADLRSITLAFGPSLSPFHRLLCTTTLTSGPPLFHLCALNATSWPTAWSLCLATTQHSPAAPVPSDAHYPALSFLTPFRRNPAAVADRPSFLTSCLHCFPLQPHPSPRDPRGRNHGCQSASGEQSGPLRCHSRSYDV